VNAQTAQQYERFLVSNYAPPPLAAVRGVGCRLWDDEGREYLDFTSGIAVSALGHSHPRWVEAVQRQAEVLVHASNLFAVPGQGELAERLAAHTPPGRFLFVNSGAEANEALLKLARLHGQRRSGAEGERCTVVTAERGFHGRTFGGMAATPQEKIRAGFRPMLPGFRHAPLNDLDAFAAALDDSVAAVFLETVQGEGGIFPADPGFLRGLRELCTERGILLMLDEVQCGIGRTGTFFAFEEAGIEPDAIGMAKGLGGGFPVGAIWVAEASADLFAPGSHGTTFGGQPLACAAALAVLDVLEEDDLVRRVRELSRSWIGELEDLVRAHPDRLREVRGRGFLVGIGLHGDPRSLAGHLREKGLLAVPAGEQTLRLLPPLVAGEAELAQSVRILREVLGGNLDF
jgi:acetylornithine aminotransferase/acetylornithine/N-succinyldiaminopimelate aminotransferase